MNMPSDMKDNSIVVLMKINGKQYSKAGKFNPKDYPEVDGLRRFLNHSLELTIDKIYGKTE